MFTDPSRCLETLAEVVATRWKKGGGRHGTIWFDILKWNNISRDLFLIAQKQPAAKESAVTPKAFISDIQSLVAHLSAVGAGNPFIEFLLSFSPVTRVGETQSLCSWHSQPASVLEKQEAQVIFEIIRRRI